MYVQRSAQVDAPGLVSFITAVAYHCRPSLPAAFTQPDAPTLADLCSVHYFDLSPIQVQCARTG